MRLDPSERLSAHALLQLPWMEEAAKGIERSPVLLECLPELRSSDGAAAAACELLVAYAAHRDWASESGPRRGSEDGGAGRMVGATVKQLQGARISSPGMRRSWLPRGR